MLGSDFCQCLPDVGKHVTSTLAVASVGGLCPQRFGRDRVAGEPVRAAGAAGGAAGGVSRTVSVAPTIKIILFADGTNNWPSGRVFPG